MRICSPVAVAIALAGCGDTPEIVCDGRQDTELGTGDSVYLALDNGDKMPIFDGPQGGSHVYVAVEACNIDGPIDVRYTVFDDTLGQFIASADYGRRPLRPSQRCCGTAVGLQGFLAVPSPTTTTPTDTGYTYSYGGGIASDLDGHELTIVATVVDAAGEQFQMTRQYVGSDAGVESGSSSFGK